MKSIFPIFLLMLLVTSCTSDNNTDELAAGLLDDARFALKYQHYDAARDTILSLRKHYPTAIQARKQAILLLDSIEMAAAADSLKQAAGDEWERLHIKTQFFERKLKEDLLKDK